MLPAWAVEMKYVDKATGKTLTYHDLCPKTPMIFFNHYWDGIPNSPDWPLKKPLYLMANIEMYELQAKHYWGVDAVLCKTAICARRVRTPRAPVVRAGGQPAQHEGVLHAPHVVGCCDVCKAPARRGRHWPQELLRGLVHPCGWYQVRKECERVLSCSGDHDRHVTSNLFVSASTSTVSKRERDRCSTAG